MELGQRSAGFARNSHDLAVVARVATTLAVMVGRHDATTIAAAHTTTITTAVSAGHSAGRIAAGVAAALVATGDASASTAFATSPGNIPSPCLQEQHGIQG